MLLKCKQNVWMQSAIVTALLAAVPATCAAAGSSVSRHGTNDAAKQQRHRAVHILGVSLDLSGLQLTDDQERKIKAARKFTRLKLHELKQAKTEKVAYLKTILFDPAVTEAQIRTCGEEIQRLQASIDNINLDSLIQLRSILTLEQRSRLAKSNTDNVHIAVSSGR